MISIDDLKSDILSSLKKGDTVRTETLRFLLSAVRYEAIAKYAADWESKVTSDDLLAVIKKQVKSHHESIAVFEKAGRKDLAQAENKQLAILEAFLPVQLPDEELRRIIAGIITPDAADFGQLMKTAMARVAGKADGGRVAQILREMLAQVKKP